MLATVIIAGLGLSSIGAILAIVGVVGAAFLIIFGARAKQSRSDLTSSVSALQGRLLADQDEIRSLNEKLATQTALIISADKQTSDLRQSVRVLERVVTGVDVIRAGFEALGVDPKLLQDAFDKSRHHENGINKW